MADDMESGTQSNTPSSEPVRQRFTVIREWDGKECEVDLSATSADDAIARTKKILPHRNGTFRVIRPEAESDKTLDEREGDTHASAF